MLGEAEDDLKLSVGNGPHPRRDLPINCVGGYDRGGHGNLNEGKEKLHFTHQVSAESWTALIMGGRYTETYVTRRIVVRSSFRCAQLSHED